MRDKQKIFSKSKPESKTETASDIQRREFLKSILQATGKVTFASGTIYMVSLITSKNGNTAGAK